MKKSKHIMVVGSTRSGKTWFLRMLLTRFYMALGLVAVMSDIKPDYYASINPLQSKFHRFLLPKEKPQGFPIESYYPYFLQRLTNKIFPNTNIFQLNINDMSVFDFYTLVGAQNWSDSKRIGIEKSFNKVKSGEITNLHLLKVDIRKNDNISGGSRNILVEMINNLENMGVIGDRFDGVSFADVINAGKIPCLTLAGFEKAGRYSDYASAYLAVILRKLCAAKREGILPINIPLLMIFDEVNRFCPNTGTTAAKEEIVKDLDLMAQYGGSLVFSTQDYKRVPSTLLEQCSMILFPYNILPSAAREILKEKASYEVGYPLSWNVEIANQIGMMRKHKSGNRDWLLIDADRKVNYIINPLAPLGAHRLEGM